MKDKNLENEIVSTSKFDKEKEYWITKLSEKPAPSGFIPDYQGSDKLGTRRGIEPFLISDKVYQNLIVMSNRSEYGMLMILLSGINYLLHKYTGAEEIVIGSPVLKGKVYGAGINQLLVLRNRVTGVMTFKTLLLQVKEDLNKAVKNSDYYPFTEIIKQLSLPQRVEDAVALKTVALLENLQDGDIVEDQKSDLIFSFAMTDTAVEGKIYYYPELFSRETVTRLQRHLVRFFTAVSENSRIRLADIDILSDREKQQVLSTFNETELSITGSTAIDDQFAEQANRTPDRAAVSMDDELLTYREFNNAANRFARFFQHENGIKSSRIIGFHVSRSLEMPICTMAIHKLRAVLLPFDSKYPLDRIRHIVEDSGADVILKSREIETPPEVPSITIPDGREMLAPYALPNIVDDPLPAASAYLIYTSGSTGIPKGVMLSHRGVINHAHTKIRVLELSQNDILGHTLSISFVASIWQTAAPLFVGAQIRIFPENIMTDAYELFNRADRHKTGVLEIVPSLLAVYFDLLDTGRTKINLGSLRLLALTGEKLVPALVERFYKEYSIPLVNAYGQTECSDDTLHFRLSNRPGIGTVPIGRPAINTRVYVLDGNFRLLPIGARGELYIGGEGLTAGYFNRPELTRKHFLPDPFRRGEKMFKTGDLARWLADGTVEFLGRVDNQIKIRGYRIELEEIEAHILNHETVKEAVAVYHEDGKEKGDLYAYVVPVSPDAERTFDAGKLRDFLQTRLPEYMIPTHFFQIEKIPLTASGKLDRLALPLPVAGGKEWIEPRDEVENKVAGIWAEVLSIKDGKVNIDANFFESGGHSLNAVVLVSRIHRELDARISLTELFENPTVRGLAKYIRGAVVDRYEAVQPSEKREYYPLSSAQKRLYILQQIARENTGYNVYKTFVLTGDMDRPRMEETFRRLVQRHESLRTSFELVNDEPVQRIVDPENFEIRMEYDDLTGPQSASVPGESSESMVEVLTGSFVRPFDLMQLPLFRLGLIKNGQGRFILMVDIHHIITDGSSMGVFIKEFMALYAGDTLPPLKLQYRDFSRWQNNLIASEKVFQQEQYWLNEFSGEIPVLNLPTDYRRSAPQSFEGGSLSFQLGSKETTALKELAASEEATLYMVMLTAFYILLYKLSGQSDIVVGMPVAGRRHADLEHIIGMFVNTLAFRNFPEGSKTYRELLREVRRRTLQALENQEYQFEDLVEKAAVTRDGSRNPIFDVVFVLQNIDTPDVKIKDLNLNLFKVETRRTKFDMTWAGHESRSRIHFSVEYFTDLFDQTTVKRFVDYYQRIIATVTAAPDRRISGLNMMEESEKRQVLNEFNNNRRDYPGEKTIDELFEETALKCSHKLAVICEQRALTYNELQVKARGLSAHLRSREAGGEALGIMAEHSIEMVVGVLGILKAGGAYLPINIDYPGERIQYLLKEGNIRLLLTNYRKSEPMAVELIDLDDPGIYENKQLEVTDTCRSKSLLAYVIYTSGSTGTPKGIMVEHRNVVRLVRNTDFVDFRSDDRILQTGALEFDASTFEIWGALLNGLQLHLLSKERVLQPEVLGETIRKNRITTMWLTSPLFNQMVEADVEILAGLRNLLVGGDVLSPLHINRVRGRFPKLNIINGYGPTENTTFSTTYLIDSTFKENIPIGTPIANSTAYIVDSYMNIVPVGVMGELCVGGDGVSRGYLNNPELTEERFLADPFTPLGRLYRTGDMARWLPDGDIEFLGRKDHQVKIRGFRVELGEIENQLLYHPDVEEAVVTVKVETGMEDGGGDYRRICAYFVSKNKLEIADLREYLFNKLPNYMLPSYFMQLEAVPLTGSGKVDRKSLPDPMAGSGVSYVEPRDDLEKKLVTIWKEVLGVERIGVNDNFFEIGGDSIKVIQVSARMRRYNLKIEVKDLFLYPTINQLKWHVMRMDRQVDQGVVQGDVQLTPIQRWFFEGHFSHQHHFNQSVMLYRPEGFEEDWIRKVFSGIVEHHDALRMVFIIEEDIIVQQNRGIDERMFDFSMIDLRDNREVEGEIERISGDFQRSFDLNIGPLAKLVLFKTDKGDYLLIMIHHLVVDGISWRILMEDLGVGYEQISRGEDLRFQTKTDSFQLWTHELKRYAEDKEILKELDYWRKIEETPVSSLPTDNEVTRGQRQYENIDTVSLQLDEKETENLLSRVNQTYNTEINDILITALGMALKEWSGLDKFMVNLEGHGRESILEGIDISRTVGWFTSQFPILLDMGHSADLSYAIVATKEMLRRIPHRGIGYGILKYLTPEEKKQGIDFKCLPEMRFNYLGQFEQESRRTSDFRVSNIKRGENISPMMENDYVVDITGMVARGRLSLSFAYNKFEYKRSRMQGLADQYKMNLIGIIDHCMGQEGKSTPSDYGDKDLSIEELSDIQEMLNITK